MYSFLFRSLNEKERRISIFDFKKKSCFNTLTTYCTKHGFYKYIPLIPTLQTLTRIYSSRTQNAIKTFQSIANCAE